jgi:hypothetical protein
MDFGKRKVRFSLEPLDPREVPAQLGQVVELPDAVAPQAQVALTAPADVGPGQEAGLNFTKIHYGWIKVDSTPGAAPEHDPGPGGDTSDPESAGKVQMQDFHFVMKVNKASPILF